MKYIDPDGAIIMSIEQKYNMFYQQNFTGKVWPNSNDSISGSGCSLIAAERVFNSIFNYIYSSGDSPYFNDGINMLSDTRVAVTEGFIFKGLKEYFADSAINVDIGDYDNNLKKILENVKKSDSIYCVIGKLTGEQHFINVNSFNEDEQTFSGLDTSLRAKDEQRELTNIDISNLERVIVIKLEKKDM